MRKNRREGVIEEKKAGWGDYEKIGRDGVIARKIGREGVSGRKLRREGVIGTLPGGAYCNKAPRPREEATIHAFAYLENIPTLSRNFFSFSRNHATFFHFHAITQLFSHFRSSRTHIHFTQ